MSEPQTPVPNTVDLNPHFQVGLDVAGRRCLVLGGNREAEERTRRLLDAGARVAVVSTECTEDLRQWAADDLITWHQRTFEPGDIDGSFIVLNTISGDRPLMGRVYELAQTQGCLVNSYDSPEFSDFGMMALVRPGHLRLAISTSNSSPALTRRLRQDLERIFDARFVEYLDLLARVRQHVRQRLERFPQRAAVLRGLVEGFGLSGSLSYPKGGAEQLAGVLRCDLLNCGTTERCSACPVSPPPD
jgi:precorrin-2 dehydrogenase / sirohydrochlorin ferrochelatase